jgi:hypothetical protein
VAVYYILDRTFQDLFPAKFFTQGWHLGGAQFDRTVKVALRLVNPDGSVFESCSGTARAVPAKTSQVLPQTRVRKYPFLCGGEEDEWGLLRLATPYGKFAEAFVSGSLTTPLGVALGHKLCKALAAVPNYLCPAFAEGDMQSLEPALLEPSEEPAGQSSQEVGGIDRDRSGPWRLAIELQRGRGARHDAVVEF